MWTRFPVPKFDYEKYKNLEWRAPAYSSQADIDALGEKAKAGDASACGAYPIMPGDALFSKLNLRGEHKHAVACILPDREVRILGRSHAWAIQRAWIVDSLDPDSMNVIADWKTTRPMNTRLGPDGGVTHSGGVLYLVCGHGYGDHWIGNRSLVDGSTGGEGFQVLSSSVEDSGDFHDCTVSFTWSS